MLKAPSNNGMAAKVHNLAQCRVWTGVDLNRRKNGVVSCSGGNRRSDLAVSLSASPMSVEKDSASLADRLRLGSMVEDGLSYKESFIVRSYEVGINKTATVETIANLMQEVGCNHAQGVGFSTDGFATTPTMRKLHLIWVTARMHIEIYRYPAWSDVIEIETWCQGEGRIGTRRDFIMKDYANGEVIGRATSKWVMMNQDTRRLERVTNDIHKEYLIFCPKELRLAFPEPNNKSLQKIKKLEDPAEYSKLGLVPRRADLDMNQHVNNVTYIGWILEKVGVLHSFRSPVSTSRVRGLISHKAHNLPVSLDRSIPQEIIDTHELQSITLDYRRECQHNDIVDSLAAPEDPIAVVNGANGHAVDHQRFLHLLRLSPDGAEINRGRTEWRKKPQR